MSDNTNENGAVKTDASKNLILFLVIAFLAGGIIGGVIIFFVKGGIGSSIAVSGGNINLYPAYAKDVGNNWVVKIDNYAVTKEEFEAGTKVAYKLYKQQYDALPPEQKAQVPMPDEGSFKTQYLDLLLNQYIVTLAALSDPNFNNKDMQVLLKIGMLQTLVQLYMQQKMPDQTMFTPSKVEVDQYYRQNRAQLEASGIPMNKIIEYITDGLKKQKFQLWQNNFLMTIKEKYKVERNPSIIQQNSSQGSMNNFNLPIK